MYKRLYIQFSQCPGGNPGEENLGESRRKDQGSDSEVTYSAQTSRVKSQKEIDYRVPLDIVGIGHRVFWTLEKLNIASFRYCLNGHSVLQSSAE